MKNELPEDFIVWIEKSAKEVEKRFITSIEKENLKNLIALFNQNSVEELISFIIQNLKIENFQTEVPNAFTVESAVYDILPTAMANSTGSIGEGIEETWQKFFRVFMSVTFNLGELSDEEIYFAKNEILKVFTNISFIETGDGNEIPNALNLTKQLQLAPAAITIESFILFLKDFGKSLSAESRMYFWKNEKGKYSWLNRPEETAKQFLITALKAKYGEANIEVHQESTAGAGFIDLYINLNRSLKIAIELKLCGNGYSSTYAIGGEDQLVHYMRNKEAQIGILIVFDSRSNEFGLGLIPVQILDNLTIHTIAIEMAPKIVKTNRKK